MDHSEIFPAAKAFLYTDRALRVAARPRISLST
jgi:hypothetical protein